MADFAGGSGNDDFTGTDAVELISGAGGDDTLGGGGGNDAIDGGDGADSLTGGSGTDTMAGGTGNDTYDVDSVGDVVTELAGEGVDTIRVTTLTTYDLTATPNVENLTFYGPGNFTGTGNAAGNQVFGSSGNDSLYGVAGNDVLLGGQGNDFLDGGEGFDVVVYFGGATVSLAITDPQDTGGISGTDQLVSIEGIVGLDGNDSLTGDSNANYFDGGNGTDTIVAGGGNDSLRGGAGDDTLDGGASSPVRGQRGTVGGDGAFYAQAMGDVTVDLRLAGGPQSVGGGQGFDTLISIENLSGGAGNDLLSGDDTDNTLLGGESTNGTGGGDDTLAGYGGDDVLAGGVGNDKLDGGDGDRDAASYFNATSGVTVDLGILVAQTVGGGMGVDTLTSIEQLAGSAFNDTLTGDGVANYIDGAAGNDVLSGLAGADELLGSTGNDTLDGGNGDDTLGGEDGNDSVVGGAGNDMLSGGDGTDTLGGGDNNDTVSGGNGADSLNGGNGDDTLFGDAGNDTLTGAAGNDLLEGGADNDVLNTGANQGVDTLNGGTGNDTINLFNLLVFTTGTTPGTVPVATFAGSSINGGDGFDYLGVSSRLNFQGTLSGIEGIAFASAGNFDLGTGSSVHYDAAELQIGSAVAAMLSPTTSFRGTGEIFVRMDTSHEFDASGYVYEAGSNIRLEVNGTSGDDTITGTNYDDDIEGGGGDDDLPDGNNRLNGGGGNDTIEGGSGNDIIDGGSGNDVIGLSAGQDIILNFERGQDRFDLSEFGFGVFADLQPYLSVVDGSTRLSVTYNGALVSHTFQNVTGLDASDFILAGNNAVDHSDDGTPNADFLPGAGLGDTLAGLGGDDTLAGFGGDDSLNGAAGNDVLDGGSGNDAMAGGIGDDTYVVDSAGDVVTENASEGSDTIQTTLGSLSLAALANVENLTFTGAGNFAGTGNAAANVITGGAANDSLNGADGADTLLGGLGTDTLSGGNGADSLFGEADNDQINGGGGDNTLSGGSGNDTISHGIGNDLIDGGDGNDVLNNSQNAGNDTFNGGAGDDLFRVRNFTGFTEGTFEGSQFHGGEGTDYLEFGGHVRFLGTFSSIEGISFLSAIGPIAFGVLAVRSAVVDALGPILNFRGTGRVELTMDTNSVFSGAQYTFDPTSNIAFDITGTDNADMITGTSINDMIDGEGGDDNLSGGDGADTISAAEGNDTVDGGAGNDDLDGGLGNDALYGGAGNDLLDGDDGNDTLAGGLVGGLDSDVFKISAGLDRITDFTPGVDRFDLSDYGFDSFTSLLPYLAQSGADTVLTITYGGITNTTTFAGVALANLTAGDFIFTTLPVEEGGTDLADLLPGGPADDQLLGAGGNDTLIGFGGNDTLEGGGGNDSLVGGSGSDTATYSGNRADYAVSVQADGSVWVTDNRGGNPDGADTLSGVESLKFADQTVSATAGLTLGGDTNDNSISGGGGDDTLSGLGGNDLLTGNSGNDSLTGGDGEDFLRGGAGNDVIDGGSGLDRAGFFNAPGAVRVDLTITGPQDTGEGTDTLIDIEHVSGTAGDDILIGNDGDNWIWGGGNLGGNDTLSGGGGNDLIQVMGVPGGNDVLDGGSGTDILSFNTNGTTTMDGLGFRASLATQGGAAQDTGQGTVTLSNLEGLSGSFYADTLSGDSGANLLAGGLGADSMSGGDGNDTLLGDGAVVIVNNAIVVNSNLAPEGTFFPGNDTLIGGNGNDTLEGGSGDDVLDGGAGADRLVGGEGNDVLVQNGPALSGEVFDGGAGTDTLRVSSSNPGQTTGLFGETIYTAPFFSGQVASIERIEFNSVAGSILQPQFLWFQLGAGLANSAELVGGAGVDQLVLIPTVAGTYQLPTFTLTNWTTVTDGSASSDAVVLSAGTGGNYTLRSSAIHDGWQALFGNTGNDTLEGGEGYDYLVGNDGNDVMTGAVGNDILVSGAGNDTLDGGLGNDALYGGAGNDLLDGDDGNDTLAGGLTGGLDADVFKISAGLDRITDFTPGVDRFDLSDYGFDSFTSLLPYLAQSGADTVLTITYGGITNTTTFAGVTLANLTAGDFIFTTLPVEDGGTDLADLLPGGPADDQLLGAGGNDTLIGFGGNDTLGGGGGNDSLVGGAGNDTATYSGNRANYTVSVQANGSVWVTDNRAVALDGADTLSGVESLQFADQTVSATAGFVFVGTDVADTRIGGGGDDTLSGLGGDDLLQGRAGNDIIDGGAGVDRSSFFQILNLLDAFGQPWPIATQGATIDLRITEAQNTGAGMDRLISIENVSGTVGSDTLIGNDVDNVLWGSGSGNDSLSGNGGNDLLIAGLGSSTVSGGVGNDTFAFDQSVDQATNLPILGAASVSLALQGGSQTYAGGTLWLDGIENLSGSQLNDTLTGDTGANVLAGSSGNDLLDGGEGNDVLLGDGRYTVGPIGSNSGAGAIRIIQDIANEGGVSGNDTLIAGGGNDSLAGGGGNDVLDGGSGNDTLVGGLGDDTYLVDAVGDVVTEGAGEGTDTVQTTLGSLSLAALANVENLTFTGAGNFAGTGNAAANVITGGAGNDTLDGGAGADTLAGGLGDDTYLVDAVGDVVTENASQGSDTIQTTLGSYSLAALANVENLTFTGAGNFAGTGNAAANVITGGAGNDTLDGGAGADTLAGGLGDDTYFVDAVGDTVTEGALAGTDTIQTTLGSLSLAALANVENLTFTGTGNFAGTGNAAANAITGGAGNDTLDGGAGNDTLVGGLGNDTYLVDAVGDTVTEGALAGTDTIQTTLGSLSLAALANVENLTFTGAGNFAGTGNVVANVITGGAGNDTLDGGAGNDTLVGGAGVNTLNGGTGDDTFVVTAAGGSVVEATRSGTDTVQTTLTAFSLAALSNVENLTFTGTGNFAGTGDTADNVLTGGAGNDTLDGGGGNDTLTGGAGDDTYVVDVAGDVVTEAARAGTDTIRTVLASFNLSSALNVENLTYTGTKAFSGVGTNADNVLTGAAGDDTLDGGAGDDTLVGGAGADVYVVDDTGDVVTELAGQGVDTVRTTLGSYTLTSDLENLTYIGTGKFVGVGNGAGNAITGGAGNDTLSGGLGNDTLTGGAGSDVFRFDTLPNAATNVDSIVDFTPGTDQIALENAVFTALGKAGGLTASMFRSGNGVTTAADADDFIIFNSRTGDLYYDPDGVGGVAAIQIATLSKLTLSAGDFIVT